MRFYAEYNIMEIDEDNYSYALVGLSLIHIYYQPSLSYTQTNNLAGPNDFLQRNHW